MAVYTAANSGLTLVDGKRGKQLMLDGRRVPTVAVEDDGVIVTVQIPSRWVNGSIRQT